MDEHPYQFTLRDMFLVTTQIAVLCAVAACAPHFPRSESIANVLTCVAFAWPFISAVVVSSINRLDFVQRVYYFFYLGGLICVLSYCFIYPIFDGMSLYQSDMNIPSIKVTMATIAIVYWIIQLTIVLGSVLVTFREKARYERIRAASELAIDRRLQVLRSDDHDPSDYVAKA